MKGTRHGEEQIIAILKQGEAGVATAEFYKSGHEPWRPAELPSNTCFIGT